LLLAAILIARHLEAQARIPTIAAPSCSHSAAMRRFEAAANNAGTVKHNRYLYVFLLVAQVQTARKTKGEKP
jgi:hypothetical protein